MTVARRYVLGSCVVLIAIGAAVRVPSARSASPKRPIQPVHEAIQFQAAPILPATKIIVPVRSPAAPVGLSPTQGEHVVEARNEEDGTGSNENELFTGRAQLLQTTWEGEEADEAWTDATAESLADMVANAGLAAEVVQLVECHASLCRIELAFDDLESARKLGPVVAANPQSFEITRAHTDHLATAPLFVVYAARPGERIEPQMDSKRGI